MGLVYSEIGRALEYLFVAFIAYVVYDTSLKASDSNRRVLLKGLLICAGIACLGTLALGSASCIEYQDDVRGGICYEYADDGYEPTNEEFFANFAFLLTVLYGPVILAIMKRRNIF